MTEYIMYLRKSRQDDPTESVEEVVRKHEIILQEHALRTIGYRIPPKDIYKEVLSGETIESREEIKKVFSRLEKEDIKGVFIKDVSRLTRGDLLDMGIVLHAFLYTKTLIITPMKTYDLSDKFDRKYFESELQRGSDYLDYTKEILTQGREASKRRGNFIHNYAPYGYDRIKVGKDWTLVPNPTETYYVKLAFQMYSEGIGAYLIADKIEELGAKPRKAEHFTEAVIRQMLKNPVYTGKIKIGERTTEKQLVDGKVVKKRIRHKDYEIVDGKHEPIISQELFDVVQARRGSLSKETSTKELRNMWAGLIKCARCGGAVERAMGSNKRAYRIRCKNLRNCDCKSHRFDEVEEALIEQLKAKLKDVTIKIATDNKNDRNEKEAQIEALKQQLADEVKKQERLCEFLEAGVYSVDMFVARNSKAKVEIERLKEAVEHLEAEIPKEIEAEEYLATFHQALEMLKDESYSVKEKNIFLKKIINVIYYDKSEEAITLDVRFRM